VATFEGFTSMTSSGCEPEMKKRAMWVCTRLCLYVCVSASVGVGA
jgi:hypothetical protein